VGSALPNLVKSESGSSYRWGTPPTDESVPQADAAALTRLKKSVTEGRNARWVCQLSSNSFQILSEMPSLSASAGLKGFPPPKTLNTTSDEDSFPNGSVPVSTYTRRVGMRVHVRHRVVHTWYITIAIAYTSASFEGVHLSSPNLEGTRSSGAIKGVVPPPTSDFAELTPRLGSCTMVMNPKSARHAVTGLAFVIRMLA
jgi:hypothetical protein